MSKGNITAISVAVVVITAVAFVEVSFVKVLLPFNVDTALVALFFIYIGFLLKVFNVQEKIAKNVYVYLAVLLICLAVPVLFAVFDINKADMLWKTYDNVAFFLIAALSGSEAVFLISYMVDKYLKHLAKIITFYGKNTLVLLAFHHTWGWVVLELIFGKIGLPYGSNILTGNVEDVLYAILVILLLTPVILLFNKFIPFAVGKKRVKKVAPVSENAANAISGLSQEKEACDLEDEVKSGVAASESGAEDKDA